MGIKPSATVFLSWFRSEQPVRRPRRWNGDFDALEGRQLLSAAGVHGHLATPHIHAEVGSLHANGGGNHHRQMRSFVQTNLVSDQPGVATIQDTDLVNAWGLAAGPMTPWWVADNGTGVSTLYNGSGVKQSLTVTIPGDNPTGLVFNPFTTSNPNDFVVSSGGSSGPATFIFANESGEIDGWNPKVPPPAPSTAAQTAVLASDAVYKGLAIGTSGGANFLYATNFHAGTVDVFDSSFHHVTLAGTFTDSHIPKGYAPFGIQNIDGNLYVTYAKQNAMKHDDVAGAGHGFVDVFDTSGHLLNRIATRGTLNSPWGIALAPPSGFGRFSGDLLIGNFGDGRINAFKFPSGGNKFQFDGQLTDSSGRPITIDGLWSLQFGNGDKTPSGPTNTLFFTAGPNHENDGLFGTLTVASM